MCVNKFQTTDKGFKVMPVSLLSILQWGGYGMCDNCNEHVGDDGTFIAVLNRVYCKECYTNFCNTAKYYEEDRPYEEMKVKEIQHIILNQIL